MKSLNCILCKKVLNLFRKNSLKKDIVFVSLFIIALSTFILNVNAVGLVKKFDFDSSGVGVNGNQPKGSLVELNGKLYGMTPLGGLNDTGVIFEYDISTGTYTKKFDFQVNGSNQYGSNPYGSLIKASNNKLYGLTTVGGLNSFGVLFEYDSSTNTFTKKVDFDAYGVNIKGNSPNGSLVEASNGKLYGMTASGGANVGGVIFEYDIDNDIFTKKFDFDATGVNTTGSAPKGSLVQASNGKLYGMTTAGGANNGGVIFEYDIDSNTFTKKVDFDVPSTLDQKGNVPYGSLVEASNGKLYGMNSSGGPTNKGVLFEYDIDNDIFTRKYSFKSGTGLGGSPYGSLIEASNGKLYGMTYSSGTSGAGSIFEYDFDLDLMKEKVGFNSSVSIGGFSKGSLFEASNGKLYGMTGAGGTNNRGVIFEYDIEDNTPDPFVFLDQGNVETSSVIESNAITISGINTSSPISISSCSGWILCEYKINNQEYTSSAGLVVNGDTVVVRQDSYSGYNQTSNLVLNIGGISDTFSVTTMDVPPVNPLLPVLTEVTPVPFSGTNPTPSFTFNSTKSGTITFGGPCSSQTTNATEGDNTIILNELGDGVYMTCSIIVTNNGVNESLPLHLTNFSINRNPPWETVASNSDGLKMIAGANPGRLFLSNDGGGTWNEIQPAGDIDGSWRAVASDASGEKLFAYSWGMGLYRSEDGGTTWTITNGQEVYEKLALNSTGTHLIGAGNNEGISLSGDQGETWTILNSSDSNPGYSYVATDDTGTNLFGVTNFGNLYISQDSGENWEMADLQGVTTIESNGDGTVLIAGLYGGNVAISIDHGNTWSTKTLNNDSSCGTVYTASDLEGSNLAVAIDGCRIYKSSDSGETWEELKPAGDVDQRWHFISINREGSSIATGVLESHTMYIVSNNGSFVVSNFSTSGDSESRMIEWTTRIPSSSQVLYGKTIDYGSTTNEIDTAPRVLFHAVNLPSLDSCTTYHYATVSIDANGTRVQSPDQTFTTIGCVNTSLGSGITLAKSIIKLIPTVPVPAIEEPIKEIVKKVEEVIKEPIIETPLTNEVSVIKDTNIEIGSSSGGFLAANQNVPTFTTTITEGVNTIINTIPEPVKQATRVVVKTTTDVVTSPVGQIVTTTVASAGVVTGASVSSAAVLSTEVATFSDIALMPMRLWGIIMTGLGIRKRRKPWGSVYDSVTKQPIDPAYVVLTDLNGKEISSAITDMDGRYGFLVPKGIYKLTANKQNYIFPSKKAEGKIVDEIYEDLYFGGQVEVTVDGGTITKNIPMDPLKFDWNEFEKKDKKMMKFFSNRSLWFARIANILFNFGLILTMVSVLLTPKTYNIIIFAVYVLLYILKHTVIKPKSFGSIVEKITGNPVSFAIISIKSASGQEVKKVADKIGKFFCLIQNGTYTISIKQKNPDESYTERYTQENFVVTNGVVNSKFEI